jgi:hypothetical protein
LSYRKVRKINFIIIILLLICSHNIRRYKCRENLSYRKVREINYI